MADQQVHVVGYDKSIQWTADSGGAAAEVHVTGWDWNDGGDLVEVTNTGHDGQQAFVATIKRVGVNVTMNFYKAKNLTAIDIKFGSKGTLTCSSGLTTDFEIHCIVEKVNWKQVVNGVLAVNVDVKSDALKADGTVVNSIQRAE